MSPSIPTLPPPSQNQTYVSISALESGILTLPSHLFITPISPIARQTVPSLSFLIQHPNPKFPRSHPTRLLFDLGLRSPLSGYSHPLRTHIETRHPISSSPDVVASLALGDLGPDDIDWVVLSHVHWDHIGTPSLFKRSKFVVGRGSLALLQGGGDTDTGGHAHFERDLLPEGRTVELPPSTVEDKRRNGVRKVEEGKVEMLGTGTSVAWKPLAHFLHAIDFFGDGSLFLVDAPGHLQGHMNLLARTGPETWVYLGGDACHDRRILSKEVGIAEWENESGKRCCIHVDKQQAEETIERIRMLEKVGGGHVEVVLAHDVEWAEDERNKGRFWPGTL